MAFTKFLVSSLALAGAAFADSDSCSKSATIKSQGDAKQLAGSCSTFKGDLTIDSGIAGSLNLDGFKKIDGTVKLFNATNLHSISSSTLEEITGSLSLSSLTQLTELKFDQLTTITDKLQLEAVPALSQLGFTKGVSKVGGIYITNTGLSSLSGIKLDTVGDFEATNNRKLNKVDVNDVNNITGLLDFSANSLDLKVTFPNLKTARNMTFRNVSSISIPSLKKTDGLLGIYATYAKNFSAPNLTETGGDLVFDGNSKLTSISLPKLQTVKGGFQIANNTKLEKVNDIGSLKSVGGALDFVGNISTVELSSLNHVSGDLNIQSKSNVNCENIEKVKSKVDGKFNCIAKTSHPKTDKSGGGSSSTSSSETTKSSGAGSSLAPGSAVGMSFLAVLGTFFA